MPNFLVESYLPSSAGTFEEESERARKAAELAVSEGGSIRYVRTTLLRADETCFHMFVAESLEAVEAALARVGLASDRIVQAFETGPPRRKS
jgi:hypothetical protein